MMCLYTAWFFVLKLQAAGVQLKPYQKVQFQLLQQYVRLNQRRSIKSEEEEEKKPNSFSSHAQLFKSPNTTLYIACPTIPNLFSSIPNLFSSFPLQILNVFGEEEDERARRGLYRGEIVNGGRRRESTILDCRRDSGSGSSSACILLVDFFTGVGAVSIWSVAVGVACIHFVGGFALRPYTIPHELSLFVPTIYWKLYEFEEHYRETGERASFREDRSRHGTEKDKELFEGKLSANANKVDYINDDSVGLKETGCERLTYYVISTNLVTYLMKKLHERNVSAARNGTTWGGTCYLAPLTRAIMANAYGKNIGLLYR
ncbi:hypothetical protein G4B88_023632 [Cannabis sativa]|uniref:Uncharacterized protein n=1 Tax=Cannabis sativa TaxID=3483 RepID=A0A7J6HWG4_CANSA|nr:hypothetical protein G4B88_023632 [Cannabis sativa]